MAGLAPGFIVGNAYRVVSALNEGGMGAVYVAEHLATRKHRALKVMHPTLMADHGLRDRFLQESQVGSMIQSEHVVEVVDAGFDEQLQMPWLAMELLEGEDLGTRLARGPVDALQAYDLVSQLCHALGAAHAAHIVHRDLKPENVFIARAHRVGVPFTVKVLDFGIAKVVAEAKATRMRTAAIGTPLWMAPEQTEQSHRIGPHTDVWAVGLLLFRMLTGRYFWFTANRDMNDVTGIVTEVVRGAIPSGSQRAAELGAAHLWPAALDPWLARCLDREPTRRYPNANACFEALGPLLKPQSAPTHHGWAQTAMGQPVTAQDLGGTVLGGQLQSGAYAPVAPPPPTHPAQLQSGAYAPVIPQNAQGTPPGVVAHATGGGRKPKSSGTSSFLVGLGSVVVLGAIAFGVVRIVQGPGNDAPQPEKPVVAAKAAPLNKWIRVELGKKSWTMGVENDLVSPLVRGFRPARQKGGPPAAFEIQQHEVTWAEVEPWLESEKKKLPKVEGLSDDKAKRAKLPATGLSWQQAVSYCKSIGGNLPTEEQWELAARGSERRKFAWGDETLDLHKTRVFVGDKPTLSPVMTSEQDKTNAKDEDAAIYDLMGNAQEWTIDLYNDDYEGQDESWVQAGGVTFRAVRGLPVAMAPDAQLMKLATAAWREPVCATGACASGKGTGDTVNLVRVAFATAAETDAQKGSRKSFETALSDGKADLGACLDKDDEHKPFVLKATFARPLKAVPLCIASDNQPDPMECCTGKVCQYAPHRLEKYDPAKVTVAPADGGESAALTCGKTALEKKLVGIKWPNDAEGEWTATVLASRIEAKAPKAFAYIGFRCARVIPKDKD